MRPRPPAGTNRNVAPLVIALLLAASPALAQHYRWDIKTRADQLAASVRHQVATTVDDLNRMVRPPHGATAQGRVFPVEQTVYTLTGKLLMYTRESDGDIHMVIQDEATQATLIAEIPDPDRVSEDSPWRELIGTARETFEGEFIPTSSRRDGGRRRIALSGVGFWDIMNHGTGASDNGVEIHPVLALSFP